MKNILYSLLFLFFNIHSGFDDKNFKAKNLGKNIKTEENNKFKSIKLKHVFTVIDCTSGDNCYSPIGKKIKTEKI